VADSGDAGDSGKQYAVELTAYFLERLDSIEAFLTEADAAFAFDDLLADLRGKVVRNLGRFPRMGRRYLDRSPQSVESLAQLAALPTGAANPSFSISPRHDC
jgi:plasmid stabilization system protein ParE